MNILVRIRTFLIQRRMFFVIVFVGAVGAVALLSILSSASYPVGPFQVTLSVQIFNGGFSELSFPPLGSIRAQTHVPPLKMKATLENVNVQSLEEMLGNLDKREKIINELISRLKYVVRLFVIRSLLLAAVGGVLAALLVGLRRGRELLVSALAGVIIVGSLFVAAYATYDANAFLSPEFQGVLKAAPWMIGLVEEGFNKVNRLAEQLTLIATNAERLFAKVEEFETLGAVVGDIRILHVSDFHNNPAGMRFIAQVVAAFDVDLVIDTGDVTDFGTALEAQIAQIVGNLNIPYLLVGGNHDSPKVLRALGELDNVILLDGEAFEYSGLIITGINDPFSGSEDVNVPPAEVLKNLGEQARQGIEHLENKVGIFAVHNPVIARRLVGVVPVLLVGHTHKVAIQSGGGSVMINAGTSGAAGLRGLQVRSEVPYSTVLLHIVAGEDGLRLVAADVILVNSLASGFRLERKPLDIVVSTGK